MYDVLIVGLGCGGYTAAVYCARYKLKVFIVVVGMRIRVNLRKNGMA
jgi:thioredoxin reductase